MVILAVSGVAELKAQEFTVIPVPKLQVAPLWKLLPLIITLGRFCPCAPELGLTELTVGGGGGPAAGTEKPLVSAPLCVSGLVTVTLRVPVVALALMEMFAVSCVAELNAQEFTVIPAPKLQVAPLWKLLPAMITLVRFCPCAPELGLTEL